MARTILVADDDRGCVATLETYLSQKGYTTFSARDGQEAIEKARRLKPDLIIMDVDMPRMDGDEAYNILKSQAETKQIPVLFLTGLRTEQEIEEDGEENILPKPVHFEQLFIKVQKLIPQ